MCVTLVIATNYFYTFFNICSALVDDESTTLTCNTQKDQHARLNMRTAGTCIVELY